MPFMKRKLEEDDVPPQRVERTERIVQEVKDEPVEEYEEEPQQRPEPRPRGRPPALAQPQPDVVTVKVSLDELRADINAHLFAANSIGRSIAVLNLPPEPAATLVQNLAAKNIQRAKDIEEVLKAYEQRP